MKVLQGFLIFMGVLAVLAVAALIVGYVLALLPPDVLANMRPSMPTSEAVDSLNQKMDDFKKAAVAAAGDTQKAITLTVSEDEINSWAVQNLAEGSLPATKMQVNFNDGYLLTYTEWNFPWFKAKTGLMGSIDIDNGKPKFVTSDFFLGKLPLPSDVNSSVEGITNILIKLYTPLDELNLDLKEVTISDGQIKIVATPRKVK